MSRPAKNLVKWCVGLGLGALFASMAATEWPLGALFAEGVTVEGTVLNAGTWRFDMLYLLPYFAVLTAIHFLRVVRWAPLLKPIADIDFKRLNQVSAVGFMYLFILPLRLGELARPYLIADRGDIKMSQALATVVVERIVDGLIVALILFGVLLFVPQQGSAGFLEIRAGAYIALAVFGGAMLVLVAAYLKREATLSALNTVLSPFSKSIAHKVNELLVTFYSGLDVLPHARYLWAFVGYSLVYWVLNGFAYYVLALGFSGLALPLIAGYAMMCCVVVGMMLPNPPANVGMFWYFLLKPLVLYGVATGDTAATAFALAAWLGQFLQQTGFGLYFLIRKEQRDSLHFDSNLARSS